MEFNIEKLVRPNVRNLKPYSSARDEFEGSASVFLDANESPYPARFNRYPDPHQNELKENISILKKVAKEKIFLGNGSDEAIDLLIRAFCEPGQDEVLIPEPTYGMYTVSAQINNIKINSALLTTEFELDTEEIFRKLTPKTKLVFLCSPNNPTGNLLSESKITTLLEKFNGLVVIDEAYIDFTSSSGFISRLDQFKNLVVLQTLSKAWGLAALRIGMCFASEEIIQVLNKIKPPYNISGIAQSLAIDGLAARQIKDRQVEEIIEQRQWLTKELNMLGIVERVYPSEANFLLAKVKNAENVYRHLITKGIVVRNRSKVIHCGNCLRISVGTQVENKMLIDELSLL